MSTTNSIGKVDDVSTVRRFEEEEANVERDKVLTEPSKKEGGKFKEWVSATRYNDKFLDGISTTYWTADNNVHSWDGARWSLDSSIPSMSTNDDDKEEEETNDIVHIEPGQFEVYIDPRKELDKKQVAIMTAPWRHPG